MCVIRFPMSLLLQLTQARISCHLVFGIQSVAYVTYYVIFSPEFSGFPSAHGINHQISPCASKISNVSIFVRRHFNQNLTTCSGIPMAEGKVFPSNPEGCYFWWDGYFKNGIYSLAWRSTRKTQSGSLWERHLRGILHFTYM